MGCLLSTRYAAITTSVVYAMGEGFVPIALTGGLRVLARAFCDLGGWSHSGFADVWQ